MEAISRNLGDPAWWFTLLFFVAIALAIPSTFRTLRVKILGIARHRKLINLNKVKALRWDILKIHLLLGRASANFMTFVALCLVFGFLLLFTPMSESFLLTLVASLPVYVFEILWVLRDSLARQTMGSRTRLAHLRRIAQS